jgi:DNA modification methylase
MAKRAVEKKAVAVPRLKPSSLLDTRVIYCGDNIDRLKNLPDASIDFIYIDPPFNSNRNYEVFWGETKEKRAFEDRHESTRAYIDYMRPRCVELARVLKKTGSFYYHCDWHASHYVKVMLDQIFGENNFQSEIIWKRTSAHSSSKRYGPVHDSIFFYTGSSDYTWNQLYEPYDENYLRENYRNADKDGRKWKSTDLTGDGIRHGDSGKPWRDIGVTSKGRHWAIPDTGTKLKGKTTQEKLDELDAKGLIYWPEKEGGMPRYKQYADEMPGIPLQTVWNDIPPIGAHAAERLGYPTQKPLALLERLIKTSSNENDIVLDAFCGCGTALVAAHKLKRQWIGIDISPTACRVMAKRLRRDCALPENEDLWAIGRGFIVRDLPKSEEELRKYPHFEFENWAVVALGGIKNKTQVGDKGIDGRIFPVSALDNAPSAKTNELPLEERFYPLQVKQKDKAGRPDIDSFETAMRRAKCDKGFFVSFDYTSDALREIDRFFREEHKIIIPLTVREILDEEIASKLA